MVKSVMRSSFPQKSVLKSLDTIVQIAANIGLNVESRRSHIVRKSAEDLFGVALREFRKELGLTQEELAFQSGYHPTYIGQVPFARWAFIGAEPFPYFSWKLQRG